jgi:hypothetical protein
MRIGVELDLRIIQRGLRKLRAFNEMDAAVGSWTELFSKTNRAKIRLYTLWGVSDKGDSS